MSRRGAASLPTAAAGAIGAGVEARHLAEPSSERLHDLLKHMAAAHWVTDARLRLRSAWGADFAGIGPAQIRVGLTLPEILEGNGDDAALLGATRRALNGDFSRIDYEWKGRAYRCHIEPLRDENGTVTGTLGMAVDIQEHREAEAELRRQAELLWAMAATANSFLATPDLSEALSQMLSVVGPVMEVERAYVFELHPHPGTGEAAVSLRESWRRPGFTPQSLTVPIVDLPVQDLHMQATYGALERGEIVSMTPADMSEHSSGAFREHRFRRSLVVPVFVDAALWGVLALEDGGRSDACSEAERSMLTAVAADIGAAVARRRSADMAQYRSYHDQLTDLPNRQLLLDRVGQALRLARRNDQLMALIVADLDRFKLVNDSLGHAVGDKLLTGMRDRLVGVVGDSDTVARIAGDEFAVLLPGHASVEDAVRVAQNVLEQSATPFEIGGRELYTNVSIGIAVFPFDGESPEELLRNAGSAQQRAKNQGGGAYQLYTPEMNATAFERLVLENSLRSAVGSEELSVYYQPLLDLRSGRVDGFEALVRWKHPRSGMVLPDEFIPLAETTGLIIPLGEQVLRSACLDVADRGGNGGGAMRVAINLSPRQFRAPRLVEMVQDALEESGLDGDRLELELTERVFLDDIEESAATLGRLKSLGVRVVIDDFGVGYSSLSYLKDLPVDALKIDRVFVHEVTTDAAAAAIAGTIIDLAHSLRMEVTSEGVETEQQLRFFTERGCDRTQGFLFSGPQPVHMLDQLTESVRI